jgi:hypothetical protein
LIQACPPIDFAELMLCLLPMLLANPALQSLPRGGRTRQPYRLDLDFDK